MEGGTCQAAPKVASCGVWNLPANMGFVHLPSITRLGPKKVINTTVIARAHVVKQCYTHVVKQCYTHAVIAMLHSTRQYSQCHSTTALGHSRVTRITASTTLSLGWPHHSSAKSSKSAARKVKAGAAGTVRRDSIVCSSSVIMGVESFVYRVETISSLLGDIHPSHPLVHSATLDSDSHSLTHSNQRGRHLYADVLVGQAHVRSFHRVGRAQGSPALAAEGTGSSLDRRIDQ